MKTQNNDSAQDQTATCDNNVLVYGIISYEGRQWLAEEYSEEIGNGAWMASPIY